MCYSNVYSTSPQSSQRHDAVHASRPYRKRLILLCQNMADFGYAPDYGCGIILLLNKQITHPTETPAGSADLIVLCVSNCEQDLKPKQRHLKDQTNML